MIRILADENVHSDIVSGLRKAGYEVLFVSEISLAGKDDQTILEYSEKHNLLLRSLLLSYFQNLDIESIDMGINHHAPCC